MAIVTYIVLIYLWQSVDCSLTDFQAFMKQINARHSTFSRLHVNQFHFSFVVMRQKSSPVWMISIKWVLLFRSLSCMILVIKSGWSFLVTEGLHNIVGYRQFSNHCVNVLQKLRRPAKIILHLPWKHQLLKQIIFLRGENKVYGKK